MRIINEKKIEESYTAYDIKSMIDDGELGMLCDGLLDELSNAIFQIKQTDKLENFFSKYYRSATGYVNQIENVIEILYRANKKG